jgi:phage gp46-like protein
MVWRETVRTGLYSGFPQRKCKGDVILLHQPQSWWIDKFQRGSTIYTLLRSKDNLMVLLPFHYDEIVLLIMFRVG